MKVINVNEGFKLDATELLKWEEQFYAELLKNGFKKSYDSSCSFTAPNGTRIFVQNPGNMVWVEEPKDSSNMNLDKEIDYYKKLNADLNIINQKLDIIKKTLKKYPFPNGD